MLSKKDLQIFELENDLSKIQKQVLLTIAGCLIRSDILDVFDNLAIYNKDEIINFNYDSNKSEYNRILDMDIYEHIDKLQQLNSEDQYDYSKKILTELIQLYNHIVIKTNVLKYNMEIINLGSDFQRTFKSIHDCYMTFMKRYSRIFVTVFANYKDLKTIKFKEIVETYFDMNEIDFSE